jgi:hypothetical protein
MHSFLMVCKGVVMGEHAHGTPFLVLRRTYEFLLIGPNEASCSRDTAPRRWV